MSYGDFHVAKISDTIFSEEAMAFIKEMVVGDLVENWDDYFNEEEGTSDKQLCEKFDLSMNELQGIKEKLK
tara:strand:- start:661 stop:873 length:213 start_codon:yes stop_codon:yes gene_type:complete